MQANPARQIAMLMILVALIASGLAATFTIGGQTQIAVQVCLAAIGANILILVVGGIIVATSRPRKE